MDGVVGFILGLLLLVPLTILVMYILGFIVAMPVSTLLAPFDASHRTRTAMPWYSMLGAFLVGLFGTAIVVFFYFIAAVFAVTEYRQGQQPQYFWVWIGVMYFGSIAIAAKRVREWWSDPVRQDDIDLGNYVRAQSKAAKSRSKNRAKHVPQDGAVNESGLSLRARKVAVNEFMIFEGQPEVWDGREGYDVVLRLDGDSLTIRGGGLREEIRLDDVERVELNPSRTRFGLMARTTIQTFRPEPGRVVVRLDADGTGPPTGSDLAAFAAAVEEALRRRG